MPKYKKGREKVLAKLEEDKIQLMEIKTYMYKSSIKAFLFGTICFIVSLLFNGNLIPISSEKGTILDIFLNLIKILSIILFFSFIFLGLSNSLELRGKPSSIREIIIVGALSLVQSVRSGLVFGLSLLGIIIVVFYIWLIQTKVKTI